MASVLNKSSPKPQGPWYPLQTRLGGPSAGLDDVKKENLILPAANRTPLPRSSIPQATEYKDNCEVSGNFTGGTTHLQFEGCYKSVPAQCL